MSNYDFKTENLKCFLIKRAKYISHFNKLTKVSEPEVIEIHAISPENLELTIPRKEEYVGGVEGPISGTISFDMSSEDQRDFSVWAQQIYKDAKPLSPEYAKLLSDNIEDLF